MIYDIPPIQQKILRNLATYKYLSVSHLKRLKVSVSLENLRNELRKLRRKKITDKIACSSVSESSLLRGITRQERKEDLHYLTQKGAELLGEETELLHREIRFPKRRKLRLSNDYIHRVSTIYMHISFNEWIVKNNLEPIEVLLYYDKRSKFKHTNTTIETRVKRSNGETKTPDLICAFKHPDGKTKAFILEVYNGARKRYIQNETIELLETIQETTEFSDRMKIKKTPRILITCDSDKRLRNAIEQIKRDPYFNFDRIGELLFFNTDTKVHKEFGKNWINLFGEEKNLFDI